MENEIIENEVIENETVENTTVVNTSSYSEQLEQIHNDLGVVCSFFIVFVLIILLKYAYKFWDMFFKI